MPKFSTPLEAFIYWEKNQPNAVFLKQPLDGKFINYTYKEAGEEIRKIAKKLIDYNFPKFSHIALLSKNCAHWIMSDIAIMMTGQVSIQIYPTLNDKSVKQLGF